MATELVRPNSLPALGQPDREAAPRHHGQQTEQGQPGPQGGQQQGADPAEQTDEAIGAHPGDALVVPELAHLPALLQPDDEPDGRGHQGAVDGSASIHMGFSPAAVSVRMAQASGAGGAGSQSGVACGVLQTKKGGFPGKAALIFRKKYSESLNPYAMRHFEFTFQHTRRVIGSLRFPLGSPAYISEHPAPIDAACSSTPLSARTPSPAVDSPPTAATSHPVFTQLRPIIAATNANRFSVHSVWHHAPGPP